MNSENIKFLDASILVEPGVFTPRAESEIFIPILKNYVKDNMNLLELGTGTGAISIAIALNFPNINITSVDKNIKAIECAKRNCKLNNVYNNISFLESDWFSNIRGRKFDLIISNPPYLSKMNFSKYRNLSDPKESLFAEDNGLFEIKSILDNCKDYARDGSTILLEHSHSQTLEIKEYTTNSSIRYLKTYHDNLGFNRISLFKKI